MKTRHLTTIVVIICLAVGPTFSAEAYDKNKTHYDKEEIGKILGAAAGALLGTQIGKGTERLAAVAIGTLAGYWVGGKIGEHLSQRDQAGIAYTTHRALETGQTQTWHNPDTGVATRVSTRPTHSSGRPVGLAPLGQAPTLKLIDRFYIAETNVNVRGGPGTQYIILYRLAKGDRVPVVGRVVGTRWLMIAQKGVGNGFLNEMLLSASDASDDAIRETMDTDEVVATYHPQKRECRIITQEVRLPDGTRDRHRFKACRQADGSWLEM